MNGGGLEIDPLPQGDATDWPEPGGGNVRVTFPDGGSASDIKFDGSKIDEIDFVDKSIGIKINELGRGERIIVEYGVSSAGDEVGIKAPTQKRSYDFFVRTSGDKDTLLAPLDPNSFDDTSVIPSVSVQARDGDGDWAVTPTETTAGDKLTPKFTFTADGTMNGGAVSLTIPNTWPRPSSSNIELSATPGETTGIVGSPTFVGPTVTHPITFLSSGQKITINYKDVNAPPIPEKSKFFGFSQGTPNGKLKQVEGLEIDVKGAADGSGTASVETSGDIFAGNPGNTLTFTYEATGRIEEGALGILIGQDLDEEPGVTGGNETKIDGLRSIQDDWTKPTTGNSVVIGGTGNTNATVGALEIKDVTNPMGDLADVEGDGERLIYVPITSMDGGDKIVVRYSNGTAQKEAGDHIGTDNGDKDWTVTVFSKGSKDGKLAPVAADGDLPKFKIRDAKDGSGETRFTGLNLENFSTSSIITSVGGDSTTNKVPANDTHKIKIEYKAIGDMNGEDARIELEIPAGWDVPHNDTVTDPSSGTQAARGGYTTVNKTGVGGGPITPTFSARKIEIPVTLEGDDTIEITYGDELGTQGKARAPKVAGTYDFILKSQGHKDKPEGRGLVRLQDPSSLRVNVGNVGNGTGEISLSPDKVVANTANETFTLTYEATGTMENSAIRVDVPPVGPGGFSTPQITTPGAEGYTTVQTPDGGSLHTGTPIDVQGSSIIVNIRRLEDGQKVVITYGAGGTARVRNTDGSADFKFLSRTTPQSTTPVNLNAFIDNTPVLGGHRVGTKTLEATNIEGSGTMSVNIESVPVDLGTNGAIGQSMSSFFAATGRTYVFTYTAEGSITDGSVGLQIPNGWTRATTDDTASGITSGELSRVSTTAGTLQSIGSGGGTQVTVTDLNLSPGDGFSITYPNAKPPHTVDGLDNILSVTPGAFVFRTTSSGVNPNPTLPLDDHNQPSVFVTDVGGGGRFTFNGGTPSEVADVQAASDTLLTFEFTPQSTGGAAFPIRNGELRIQIPFGWTSPTTADEAGEISADLPVKSPIIFSNAPVRVGEPTDRLATKDNDRTNEAIKSELGDISVEGQEIVIPIKYLAVGDKVVVKYGDDMNGKAQPNAQDNVPINVFSRTQAGGIRTAVASQATPGQLTVNVKNASDGSGSATISGGPVSAGSEGNRITVTYTAAGTLNNGAVRLTLPSGLYDDDTGWSDPVINDPLNPGVDNSEQLGFTTVTSTGILMSQLAGDPVAGVVVNTAQKTIQANIRTLGPGQQIIFTYGAGEKGAKAQGEVRNALHRSVKSRKDGEDRAGATFLIESSRDEMTASFFRDTTSLPTPHNGVAPVTEVHPDLLIPQTPEILTTNVDTNDAEDPGILRLRVDLAAPGSGTATIANRFPEFNVNPSGNENRIHAGSSGNQLIFTYTAPGRIFNGQLRFKTPSGWSQPQGNGNSAGLTTADADGTGSSLGSESYGGNTMTVPILDMRANDRIRINYGFGGGNAGVNVPPTAGKTSFIFETRGGSSGNPLSIAENPEEEVFEAYDGSGSASVIPSTVSAGSNNTLSFTYTAAGTITDGSLALTIPLGWTTPEAKNFEVSSTGSVEVPVIDPISFPDPTPAERRVIVDINSLGPGDTVTLTYKDVVTQPTKQDPVRFFFEVLGASNDRTRFRIPSEIDDSSADPSTPVTLLRDAKYPKIKVEQIAPGSGNAMVDLAVVESGSSKNVLNFTYTFDGEVDKDQEIRLTIPPGWTDPTDDEFTVDTEGSWQVTPILDSTVGTSLTKKDDSDSNIEKVAVSGRDLVVKTQDGNALAKDDEIRFTYVTKAPTLNGVTPDTTFVVSSRGTALPAGSNPIVNVSPSGDGSGGMTVDTDSSDDDLDDSVVGASPNNNLKFVYTAVENIRGGFVSIEVPEGWTLPQKDDDTKDGFVPTPTRTAFSNNTSLGTTQSPLINDRTITVPIVELDAKDSVTIEYKKVKVQSNSGNVTFDAESQLESAGALRPLFTSPTVAVNNITNGSGKIVLTSPDPARIPARSTGNELRFLFTAEGTMNGGLVELTIPDGWSPPQETSGTAGFTTATSQQGSLGPLSFSDQKVTIPVSAIGPDQTINITYGAGSGSSGATAQENVGFANFVVNTKGSLDGDPTAIPSADFPVVEVTNALDGTGIATATTDPENVTAGGPVEINFTFNPAGTMDGGAIRLTVPDGWSAPQKNTAGGEGYTTADTTGNAAVSDLNISGRNIDVSIGQATSGDSIIVVYGKGRTAKAQPDVGTGSFSVESKGSASGTLTELLTGPIDIPVGTAGDGSGTATAQATPSPVPAGSSGNTVAITFRAEGPMNGGGIRLDVPTGWTPPQKDSNTAAGYTQVESAGGTLGDTIINGQSIEVQIVELSANQTITTTYGVGGGVAGVVAQGNAGTASFNVSSKGNANGTLTPLTAGSPSVPVGNAADGSGTGVASRQAVVEGSTGNQINFTFTSVGTMDDGAIRLTVPPGWTSPNPNSGTSGYTTASSLSPGTQIRSPTISSTNRVVAVQIIRMGPNESIQISYGAGGGDSGVTPGDTAEFKFDSRGDLTGTLQQLVDSPTINVGSGATVLGLSSAGTVLENIPLPVTVELRDDSGAPSTLPSSVNVTLTSDSVTGTFAETETGDYADTLTVTIPAGDTSIDAFYKDSTLGTATLTATDLTVTPATHEVTVRTDKEIVVTEVSVSPSIAKTGDTVMVWANGTAGETATFSIGEIVTNKAMVEEETGSYHGDFTVVVDQHSDGTYDVTVNLNGASKTEENALTIDSTAPAVSVLPGREDSITVVNGETFILEIESESGLDVEADVSDLDTTQTDPIPLGEDPGKSGLYSADITISEDNTAPNGEKDIVVTASDAAGNTASITIGINLQNGLEYTSTIPEGISLFHVPLNTQTIDGEPANLNTVGDLFNALGDDASFLITYDPGTESFQSYLGDQSAGGSADPPITADLGIITVMTGETTLTFGGDAWGGGTSEINLNGGQNLRGLPLDDPRVTNVSDIMNLPGFEDVVTSIIVSDVDVVSGENEFMVVTQPGDDGDVPVTGDAGYIIIASEDATAQTTGSGWDNPSVNGAPPIALLGHRIDNQTPVLSVQGVIVDEITGLAKEGFRVKVKNLSTKAALSAISSIDVSEGGYHMTFVDMAAAHAARVGDVLEISVDSPDPLIGVQPLRHIITTDDVKKSRIQLEELIAYEIPAETELLRNYPNPFNPETWIPFRLAEDSVVTLTIYDTAGRAVRSIDVGHKPAAVYESKAKAIYWDGRNDFGERVASGVYFYSLSAGDFSGTRKMLILK
jgi:hypothetical protein